MGSAAAATAPTRTNGSTASGPAAAALDHGTAGPAGATTAVAGALPLALVQGGSRANRRRIGEDFRGAHDADFMHATRRNDGSAPNTAAAPAAKR